MKNPQQRDLLAGGLDRMILRTLKRQPAGGCALAQHIKRTSDDLLQVEQRSFYLAWQHLLREELVKGEWGVSPKRRVSFYRLTPANTRHLAQKLSRFDKMLKGITTVLAPGES